MLLDGVSSPVVAPWRDAFAVALSSLGLYLLLAQEALHGLDVHVHVFFLTQGHMEHPFHLLYFKIIGLAWPCLAAFGLTPLHALRLLSGLGTALGVLCTHRAAASLRLSRGRALLVTVATAVTPAIVFFATVPEIHGVFAAFAGAAWWAWARFVHTRLAADGVVFGVATSLAAGVHATGHFLLPMLLLCAVAVAGGRGVPWRGLLAAVFAHAVVAVSVAFILRPGGAPQPFVNQLAFLRDYAMDPHSLVNVWRVMRDEWLIALAPWVLTSLVALVRRRTRPLAIAMAISTAAYLALAYALLDEINERGAYLLPLAFPLAWLTLLACGARIAALSTAVALAVACVEVVGHDHTEPAAWLPGLVALARETPPAMICRDVTEQEPITRELPDVPVVRVDSLLASADAGDAGYPAFCAAFDATVEHLMSIGRTVLITRGAHEALLATGKPFFARFLREHLPQHYLLDEIGRDGFNAIRVSRRQR